MKKFKFIGSKVEASHYGDPKPEVGKIYDGDEIIGGDSVLSWYNTSWGCSEWEELIDKPIKQLHKDTDLGYFAGLFIQAHIQNSRRPEIDASIYFAKELIKKLDDEK